MPTSNYKIAHQSITTYIIASTAIIAFILYILGQIITSMFYTYRKYDIANLKLQNRFTRFLTYHGIDNSDEYTYKEQEDPLYTQNNVNLILDKLKLQNDFIADDLKNTNRTKEQLGIQYINQKTVDNNIFDPSKDNISYKNPDSKSWYSRIFFNS